MRKRLRPYLNIVDKLGLEVVKISKTGSCHHKITVIYGGMKRFFIIPNSSSDHRAVLNFRQDVRRWMGQVTPQGKVGERHD